MVSTSCRIVSRQSFTCDSELSSYTSYFLPSFFDALMFQKEDTKDLSNLYSNRRKVSSFYFGRLVGSNLALEKAFMAVNGYNRTVMKDSRHQI